MLDEVPSFLLQIAPRSTLVVVGGAHESWVGVRSPPFLRRFNDGIGRHHVEATGGERRVALREDKRFAREVLWHVDYVAIVVVVADDVEGIALEEVVVRIRLVATCRDGACGIELANDVGQAFCQEGIDTLLVAIGKCGGIMSEVEDEVGLFDGEFRTIVA